MQREVTKWVTIRGNRIPIFKGENVKAKFEEMYRQRYINNWKRQEVDRNLEYYEKLNEEYNNIIEKVRSLPNVLWGEYRWQDKLDSLNASDEEKAHYRDIHYEYLRFMDGKKGAVAFLKDYRERPRGSDEPFKFNKEKARPKVQKMVDAHFNELQNKVEKKIGKIKSIYHRGGDDYEFTGTNGKCAVEVILAGGYNIQKLHTRWIVRNSLN